MGAENRQELVDDRNRPEKLFGKITAVLAVSYFRSRWNLSPTGPRRKDITKGGRLVPKTAKNSQMIEVGLTTNLDNVESSWWFLLDKIAQTVRNRGSMCAWPRVLKKVGAQFIVGVRKTLQWLQASCVSRTLLSGIIALDHVLSHPPIFLKFWRKTGTVGGGCHVSWCLFSNRGRDFFNLWMSPFDITLNKVSSPG